MIICDLDISIRRNRANDRFNTNGKKIKESVQVKMNSKSIPCATV
jgi:hypothetical protein